MIILDEIKLEDNVAHSTIVTYPRSISITHGVYDNVPDMMNMITLISQNIFKGELTNVYAGKTEFSFFNDKPEFHRFIEYVSTMHRKTNVLFSKEQRINNYLEFDSWGNEIKNGDAVETHFHRYDHLILYLTDGAPLILPELKIKIIPKRGSYYIFPPMILHGVEKVENQEKTRYCLVTNFIETPNWKLKKTFKDLNDAREKK
jgi:hypothetical protein